MVSVRPAYLTYEKRTSNVALAYLAYAQRIDHTLGGGGGGGGLLPSKRLLGMCRWMGSHFHNWTDYNGVTFLVELLEWGRKFSGFLG